jgi:hypothetical protein
MKFHDMDITQEHQNRILDNLLGDDKDTINPQDNRGACLEVMRNNAGEASLWSDKLPSKFSVCLHGDKTYNRL